MTNQEIVAFIRGCIADIKNKPIDQVDSELVELDLVEDFGLDSLDLINLLFRVEEAFGFKISEPDIDAKNLTKIANMIRYIDET